MSKIDNHSEVVETARRCDIMTALGNHLQRLKAAYRNSPEYTGPCPVCGGRDRFSINIKKQCWYCRGCETGGDVIALVRHLDGCTFREAVAQLAGDEPRMESNPTTRASDVAPPKRNDTACLRWWREAGPLEGSPGAVYLEREREIPELPPDVHEVLRFHPRCIYGQDDSGSWQFQPCILALYRDVITDEPSGVHRIAVDENGKLIGRKALGSKQGSAVKLWGAAEVLAGLVIGEGIETVLAAATRMQHRGTLLQPAWSLIDAGNLKDFLILAGIEHLTVLADADAKDKHGRQAGQDAARACARRWADAGREAVVLIPEQLGNDFNDIARRVA